MRFLFGLGKEEKGKIGSEPQAEVPVTIPVGVKPVYKDIHVKASVTPAELARIITGLADLTRLEQVVKVYGHNFDERHVSAAMTRLPGFGAQALANSLWALAKLGIKDEAFTASWFRVATRKLPEFNTQNLSNSLWAVSKLGIEDDAFTAAWLREAKVKLPGFNAQDTCPTV
eukprot:gene30053-biopygen15912